MNKYDKEQKMSKKNIKVTASDDAVINEELEKQPLKWDDLVEARKDTVGILIKQQMLFTELCKSKNDIINNDDNIFHLVDGVNKTFNDLGKEINEISLSHATDTTVLKELNTTIPTSYKTGVIDNDDDELDYIGIASKYIGVDEKILYVASTSYIDVFSKLNIDTGKLTETLSKGNEEIANIKGM